MTIRLNLRLLLTCNVTFLLNVKVVIGWVLDLVGLPYLNVGPRGLFRVVKQSLLL